MENKKVETKTESTFFEDFQNLMKTIEVLAKSEKNPFYNSKYVQLKDVLKEVKRVCLENNFIFYQTTQRVLNQAQAETLVETRLEHKDGRVIISEMPIVAKDYNDPQKVGAGLTYMRRYSLTCLLGIEEDDDDGNNASQQKPVKNKTMTTEQVIANIRSIKDKATLEEMKDKLKDSKKYTEIQKNVIELAIEETLKKCGQETT